jgi:2-keto-4-pentenoate hydratase
MNDAPSDQRFDPAPAARLLAEAWQGGAQLHELPAALRPRTLAEGYVLQDALIAAMGEAPSGWKLGVGSPLAMRNAQLARPLIGRLFASRFHRADSIVDVPTQGAITVEFETAFVLARDVAPNGPALADSALAALIAETRCSFELVRSRFTDRRAVGWPSFAGDSVGFEALVIGEPVELAAIGTIAREVVVRRDGMAVAHGLQGEARSDPLDALAALLAHARERGSTLRRGEIVTTGAAALPFDIDRNARIEAQWPGGRLEMQIVFQR